MFTGRIEEIWAQYDSEHLTVYTPAGGVKSIEIPEGASWELHCRVSASWPEVAPWAHAWTFRNDKTWGDAKRCIGGSCDYEYAASMGKMPATDVNIGRVRFWKNRAYTMTPPPDEDR